MNREKMREQVRKLRAKKSKRPVAPAKQAQAKAEEVPVRPAPKPQVKRGVVKVASLSSKRSTPTPTTVDKAGRKRHTEIMRAAQKKHGHGCGGCRRNSGG